MARMGKERLPDLSFKRYLGIMVHDIDDPHEIIKHLMDAIERSLEKLQGEELGLLAIMLYDGDWELRIWIDPESREVSILHNITEENYKPTEIYRITIEEFTVTRTAKEIHDEIAETRGLKPVKVPLDMLPSLLSRTLRIRLAKARVEEKPKVEEPTARIPAEARAISMSLCLEKLWAACSGRRCDELEDPLRQVEELGIAILGSGTEYTCIIKDAEGCTYLVVSFSGDSITIRCLSSKNEVEELISGLRSRGYEAAIT